MGYRQADRGEVGSGRGLEGLEEGFGGGGGVRTGRQAKRGRQGSDGRLEHFRGGEVAWGKGQADR